MRILNICVDDFANFAYENMLALRSIGLNCESVKTQSHPFYAEQSTVYSAYEICEAIKQYDVIQFFHDNSHLFNMIKEKIAGKKLIVYHTSSFYRKNFEAVNTLMNPYVYRSVCAMPEFMGRGAKNEVYMVGAVDTDSIKPVEYNSVSKFGHYPSNSNVKGSDTIIRIFSELDIRLYHDLRTVPYLDHLNRMSMVDVYVEMLTEKDGGGMPYGSFGITALEAAAMGKVVLTQISNADVYSEAYGFCGLNFGKDEAKMKRLITTFDNYSGEYLKGQQQITREWVVKNHSYKATAEYFLTKVLAEI